MQELEGQVAYMTLSASANARARRNKRFLGLSVVATMGFRAGGTETFGGALGLAGRRSLACRGKPTTRDVEVIRSQETSQVDPGDLVVVADLGEGRLCR